MPSPIVVPLIILAGCILVFAVALLYRMLESDDGHKQMCRQGPSADSRRALRTVPDYHWTSDWWYQNGQHTC